MSEDAMRLFPLPVPKHQFRIGLPLFLAGMLAVATRRENVRNLPPYLKRDIGLDDPRIPDWDRPIR
jgi:hypothetical protein